MQQATLGDRYRLMDKLGGGGMAKVYLAHDEVLRRDVAVKMLHEQFAEDGEFVERFRREARSAASLRHPNIVQIYDQGEAEDGSHYMAMEYLSGGTLKERILARGHLPAEEAAAVALKVAEALGAAHGKGVIHRDIKPQNVLLTEAGEPKVADFGIARAASAATISQTSRVLGTAGYMSPEQALGERACPGSDLYSLGVVLYEMLVGVLPYEADTPVAVAVKHINEPPIPPGEVNENVPAGLGLITLKLLAKRPEDRYPDASTLAADLRRVLDGLPPTGVDDGYAPPPRRPGDNAPTTVFPAGKAYRRKKRGRARTAVAAVAVLLLLGGVVFAAVEAPWEEASGAAVADRVADVVANEPEAPNPEVSDTEVSDVVGLSESEARERLEGEGFEVQVRDVESSEGEAGDVVAQSVEGGERAEEGSTVGISVGEGPASVEIPNLIYESEAQAQLDSANLELGEVTYDSNDMAAGTITSQTPAAGAEAEEGTAVDITVSTGPEEEVEAPAPAQQQPAEQQPVQSQSVEQPVEQQPVEQQPVEQQPVEQQPIQQAVEQSAEQQPVQSQSVEQPVEEQPVEEQPVEEQPVEQQPVQSQSVEQPVEEQPVVEEPVEQQPVEEQPVEQQPVEEEQPVEQQPVEEEQPVEQQPVEEEPVEQQPVEQEPQPDPGDSSGQPSAADEIVDGVFDDVGIED